MNTRSPQISQKLDKSRRFWTRAALAACVLALATAACGSDKGSNGGTAGGAGAGNGGTGGKSPALLVAERVFAPEGRSYYVSIVSDVPNAALDRSRAYEFSSADVEIYQENVYIRDRDANTITRYTVSDGLALEEQAKLSFQSAGLAAVRVRNAYLSPTRAFALDANGWRMIEWNPTTMELTGRVISIDQFKKDGLPTGSIGTPQRVGDRVFATVGWDDFTNLVTSPSAGAMLMIDANAASDAPASLLEDSRLGGAFAVYEGGDGAAYVAGTVGGDVRNFGSVLGNGAFPSSGILRIANGATSFDPEYQVNLEAITGAPGVSAVHRIDDHTVLAQIWDPETPINTVKDADDYRTAAEFIYVLVDTEAKTWTRIESIPKGQLGNAGDHLVDGKLYVNLVNETGSTVYPVTKDGFDAPAFAVPAGDLWHFERIR